MNEVTNPKTEYQAYNEGRTETSLRSILKLLLDLLYGLSLY